MWWQTSLIPALTEAADFRSLSTESGLYSELKDNWGEKESWGERERKTLSWCDGERETISGGQRETFAWVSIIQSNGPFTHHKEP